MSADVFIGYAREDVEIARQIHRYLAAAGCPCYRDETNVPGSAKWLKECTAAIRECHAYVVLVSEHSMGSEWVEGELYVGRKHKKAFVPVVLSRQHELTDEMVAFFGALNYIFTEPSLDAALPEILDAVARTVDGSKHKDAYDDEVDVRRRASYRCQVDLEGDAGGLWTGETEGGTTALVQGRQYVATAQPDDDFLANLHALPLTSEFVIEGRISASGGSAEVWAGFKFGEHYPGDYYKFFLGAEGRIRIAKRRNKKWSEVVRRAERSHLCTDDPGNVLKVVRKGSAIHVFVNGMHAATARDFDIRAGQLGLSVAKGASATYTDMRVEGVDLASVFSKAADHWWKLEIREAKQLLRYVVKYAPSYKHPDHPSDATHLMNEIRPDYRESVLIVIGAAMLPQIHDGIPAARLRDEINKKGRGHEYRFASIVTDVGLLAEDRYMKCPIISVGGAATNKITEALAEGLRDAAASTEHMHIQYDAEGEGQRVALWGDGAPETADAVEAFIAAGHLQGFLGSIWST